MENKRVIETGYLFTPAKLEPLFIIVNNDNQYLAKISKRVIVKQFNFVQQIIKIEYVMEYNCLKKFTSQEITLLRIYFDSVVATLNNDMITIYTDNISERLDVPFYKNIVHLEKYHE